MSQPEQHLPEKSFQCKDCNGIFRSAEDYRDHFERLTNSEGKPGIVITGCSRKARVVN